QVEDGLRFLALADLAHGVGVADVGLHEARPAVERPAEVLAPPGRDVVDHNHLAAPLEERVDEVRADESGAACHQSPHPAGHAIRPGLADARVVVSDRFLDSSLAYQGEARGLGVEEVARINRWATGGLVPDLTFLLVLPPAAAAARGSEADRFESEGASLQER